jgi:hypothetical protein
MAVCPAWVAWEEWITKIAWLQAKNRFSSFVKRVGRFLFYKKSHAVFLLILTAQGGSEVSRVEIRKKTAWLFPASGGRGERKRIRNHALCKAKRRVLICPAL